MIHVKGSAVAARIRYVREKLGEPALSQLKDSLSEEHRAYIEMRLLPTQWVPYEMFIELVVNADRLFGRADLEMCRDMARFSAEVSLTNFQRIFYRLATADFAIRQATRLWRVHYDSGSLGLQRDGRGNVRLLIRNFALPHRAHCVTVLGWAERSAELAGVRILRAEETRCRTRGDEVCELSYLWDR